MTVAIHLSAALKVLPLSDNILPGTPLLAVNCLKLLRNAVAFISVMSSIWTDRVTQQVYKQSHTFLEVAANVSLV